MKASHKTSLTLLERLQQGDREDAWELFVAIYKPLIAKYLTRIRLSSSDVDDLIQECFAELLTSISSFKHNGQPGAFRRWLRVVVSRRAQRLFAKRTAQPVSHERLEQMAELDQSFETYWDAEHNRHVIEQLLNYIRPEFTKTTWLAFQMHVIEDLTADETALHLGCTKNVVSISKSRVLRRLRQVGKGLIEW